MFEYYQNYAFKAFLLTWDPDLTMAFGGATENFGDPDDIVSFRSPPPEGPWVSEEARIAYDQYRTEYNEKVQIPWYKKKIAKLTDGKWLIICTVKSKTCNITISEAHQLELQLERESRAHAEARANTAKCFGPAPGLFTVPVPPMNPEAIAAIYMEQYKQFSDVGKRLVAVKEEIQMFQDSKKFT